MNNPIGKEEIVETVISVVKRVRPNADPVSENTILIGKEATIDSVGLVSLLVSLEQTLNDQVDLSSMLIERGHKEFDENPFRTVGSLSDLILKSLSSKAGECGDE